MPDGEFSMLVISRLYLTYLCSANKNLALNSIVGAAFGGLDLFHSYFGVLNCYIAAGQRCMALSVGEQIAAHLSAVFSQLF
jgi:hypothetical protein